MKRCLVAVALVLGASLVARSEERPLAARIREANLKATKAIAAKWAHVKPGESTYEGHARTLVALTLLRAGGPDERAIAKKLLDEWWLDAVAGRFGDPTNPSAYGTYVVSLGISALEALTLEPIEDDTSTLTRYTKKPMPEDLKKRLELATKALLDSASRPGAWGYAVRPFGKDGKGGDGSSDTSNTQFAALALHDAARGGVKVPDEVLEGLVDHLADTVKVVGKRQCWSYHGYGDEDRVTASMTFAALSTAAIARSLGSKDVRLGGLIDGGLVGIEKTVKTIGPNTEGSFGWGSAYQLYSLEKALDLLEIETLDGKDWFAPIAERVLKTQGAKGLYANGDLIDSCLYVLFLQRASFGTSRLGPRTVVKATPESDALVALKALGEGATPATRAAAEAALTKLAAAEDGREACALAPLAELARKNATRDLAAKWLKDLCGEDPSAKALELALARLAKVRGATPERADLEAALEKTTLLPVRAFAAAKADPDLVVEAAEQLDQEAILETRAGSRCAHAFEAVLRKAHDDLPALAANVRPAELRWLIKVARERRGR